MFHKIAIAILVIFVYAMPTNSGMVAIKKTGGSCTVGNTNVESSSSDVGVGEAKAYTASCSGTLSIGYLRHDNTETDNAKVCVYLDDGDGVPDSGDTLVSCTGAITSSAVEWASNTFASGNIVQGNSYWIILTPNTSTLWRNRYATTSPGSGGYYKSLSYSSPPADLGGTWTQRDRRYSIYVTVVY